MLVGNAENGVGLRSKQIFESANNLSVNNFNSSENGNSALGGFILLLYDNGEEAAQVKGILIMKTI